MADDFATLPLPTFTDRVEQQYFIEPLSGPSDPTSQLDRFPEELYDKTPDSHFIRFMYSLLGPAGIGWLREMLLTAKLVFYAHGFDTFDIEKFYGDPFSFPRVLAEQWDVDPLGLLTRDQWDAIRSKDESYRNRSINFFNAARAGNTPLGMELAAQSGLGHAVEVIENYQWLFDQHTDEPLGLPYYGSTTATEEFITVPRQEESKSEIQILTFEDTTISGGTFVLIFNGQETLPLAKTSSFFDLQTALRGLGTIGLGGVKVTGGPCPNPFFIEFTGQLAGQNVSLIEHRSSLVDNYGDPKDITLTTQINGRPSTDEVVNLSDEFQHNMQTALDLLRPVNTLPTVYPGSGTKSKLIWRSVTASSEYTETIKYVTGSDSVQWPASDGVVNWIEEGTEKEVQRLAGDLQQLHVSYNVPQAVYAYTEEALGASNYESDIASVLDFPSEHVGQFDPNNAALVPLLQQLTNDAEVFVAEAGISECPHPLQVTGIEESTFSPIVGGYLTLDETIQALTTVTQMITPVTIFGTQPKKKKKDKFKLTVGIAGLAPTTPEGLSAKQATATQLYNALWNRVRGFLGVPSAGAPRLAFVPEGQGYTYTTPDPGDHVLTISIGPNALGQLVSDKTSAYNSARFAVLHEFARVYQNKAVWDMNDSNAGAGTANGFANQCLQSFNGVSGADPTGYAHTHFNEKWGINPALITYP